MTSDGKSNIDCATAREQLSAYHDGELAADVRSAIREHLEGCAECGDRLAEIRELSRMAAEMPTPAVPAEIWPQLEKLLDEGLPIQRPSVSSPLRRRRTWLGLATAALVFVAVSTLGVVWFRQTGHENSHVAVNFGRYLDEFARNPKAAQQVLLTNYAGRAVNMDQAAEQLRYRPMTPESLPHGFSRKRIYLLRMPCCLCVQAVYESDDGRTLAVFEHVDDQPIWFGSRPMVHARCNGMPTSLVEVDDRLAASWKRNGRYITVIGADDVEQVSELVACLD